MGEIKAIPALPSLILHFVPIRSSDHQGRNLNLPSSSVGTFYFIQHGHLPVIDSEW
jgi:hypothetical protein